MENIKKYWIAIIVTFGLCMFIKPALCFLILGAIAAYAGFLAVILLNRISKSGIECTANIIEYQPDSDGYKTPLLEFTTMNGEIIRDNPYIHTSTDLSKVRSYRNSINKSVQILYDPED